MSLFHCRTSSFLLILFSGICSGLSLYGMNTVEEMQSTCFDERLEHSFEHTLFSYEDLKDSASPAPSCKTNCRLCRSIEAENWRAVKSWMKRKKGKEPAGWTYHRNIQYIRTPEAILASLPSWSTTTFCFKTNRGEVQAYNSYQLGVVRPVLAQIKYGFDFLFRKMGIHFRKRGKRSLVSNSNKVIYLGFSIADR